MLTKISILYTSLLTLALTFLLVSTIHAQSQPITPPYPLFRPCATPADTSPCDNLVNILDYQILANNFSTSNQASDLNQDNINNILDYQILANHFGSSYLDFRESVPGFHVVHWNISNPNNQTYNHVSSVIDPQFPLGQQGMNILQPGTVTQFMRQQAFVGGNYTFRLSSDDQVKIYLNRNLVIDHSPNTSQNFYTEHIYYIPNGYHLLTIEYLKSANPPTTVEGLRFDWWRNAN